MLKVPTPQGLPNKWIKPILCYAHEDLDIKRDFHNVKISQRKWDKACKIVDPILKILLKEMSDAADKKFKGLRISETYIRQGSARQGMKVNEPNEFDVIMPFNIIDLKRESQPTFDVNNGLIKLTVSDPPNVLQSRYPKLYEKEVFQINDQGAMVLNVRELQKSVFDSLLDKALIKVESRCAASGYTIKRRVEPPTMKISVLLEEYGEETFRIDIDVVPGMLVGEDDVHIPPAVTGREEFMKFPRYVVMKWVNRKDPTVPEREKDYLWRMSSTAFERYMTDICIDNTNRMYILTACMILKSFFSDMKSKQNQLAVLFKSYYLKMICLYLILFLTIIRKKNLSGVREALGYFLKFIRMALDAKCLPHFFLGNPHLSLVFPNSYFVGTQPYNMFRKSKDLVENARFAFKSIEQRLDAYYDYSLLQEWYMSAFSSVLINTKGRISPAETSPRLPRLVVTANVRRLGRKKCRTLSQRRRSETSRRHLRDVLETSQRRPPRT